jgi:hypothetical protein
MTQDNERALPPHPSIGGTWTGPEAEAIRVWGAALAATQPPQAPSQAEVAPAHLYTDEPEQEAIIGKFCDAGFRYDGHGSWTADMTTSEMLALAETLSDLAQPPATAGEALTDEDWYAAVRAAEHMCPHDLPHLDKQRWKARHIRAALAQHERTGPTIDRKPASHAGDPSRS